MAVAMLNGNSSRASHLSHLRKVEFQLTQEAPPKWQFEVAYDRLSVPRAGSARIWIYEAYCGLRVRNRIVYFIPTCFPREQWSYDY